MHNSSYCKYSFYHFKFSSNFFSYSIGMSVL